MNETLKVRCATLEGICDLEVKGRKEKGQNVFTFYSEGRCIKETFTYPKAKIFAEGVKFGRKC